MVFNVRVNPEIISKPAHTVVAISDLVANRWSPRVFDASHSLSHGDVLAIAEAARWSPSSNNSQPWKFSILLRGTAEFESVSTAGLTGFNQTWAPNASAYVVVMADQVRPDGKDWDKAVAFYNAGLASAQIVYEAESMGLKSHYMGGILHEEIETILGVQGVWVVNVLAIGKQGAVTAVSEELQQRESAARERKPLEEIILHGLS